MFVRVILVQCFYNIQRFDIAMYINGQLTVSGSYAAREFYRCRPTSSVRD